MHNEQALHRFGVRLLDGEQVVRALDGRRGFVEDLKRLREGFVLTTQRLLCLTRESGRRKARVAMLRDVEYLELEHQSRSWGLLILGVVLVVVVIGLLYLWRWWTSGKTVIRTQIGSDPQEAEVSRSALESAEEFVVDFFEAKTAVTQGGDA